MLNSIIKTKMGSLKKLIYLKIVGSWLMIISISEALNLIHIYYKNSKNKKGNVFNLMRDTGQNLKQTFNGKTSDACHLRSGTRQTWLTLLEHFMLLEFLASMLRK